MWRGLILVVATLVLVPVFLAAQESNSTLHISVADENGLAVASARILLARTDPQATWKAETDYGGRCALADVPRGVYQLRVEKEGFYTFHLDDLRVGEVEEIDVRLNHVQEFAESVEVVASPTAVDPTATAATAGLGNREIVNVPFPVTRDIRAVLPFLPGVLPGAGGQVHLNGSATTQLFQQLDDFNSSDPATGLLLLRVSSDAIRSIEVQGGRSSAEFGKGSGGVIALATAMGDDRFRFSATDFIPSLQNRKGILLDNLTPRATLSGPLHKGKAWFLLAPEGEYNITVVQELPDGQDRLHFWRFSNLAKAQVNLTPGNILSTSFLVNRSHADHIGLSPLNPQETTLEGAGKAQHFSAKEQSFFAGGTLVEVGFGATWFRNEERPQGLQPYVIRPDGTSGNFFRTADGRSRRLQGIANLYLRPLRWRGRHDFKFGADLDGIAYDQFFDRRPVFILRADGTQSQAITFAATPPFSRGNVEVGAFAQDRWSVSDRLLLELGARLDWDELIDRVSFSPRLASTYLPTREGNTKLTAGIGLFYDATNLELLSRPFSGQRADQFFAADGATPVGPPVVTTFQADGSRLQRPYVLSWSTGLEHLFPRSTYVRVEFLEKRGHDGFAYVPQGGPFALQNVRRDRYDAVAFTLRATLHKNYTLFASYTRSRARSNAVLDFTIDTVIFSPQAGGRLPWDAPNRLLSWGWLPLVRKFMLAYSLDWRDGYPFFAVNENRQLVGPPDSHRFPDYFSLNVHVERRFRLGHYEFALRGGFNNITDHGNPGSVVNNVDSPRFLTFSGFQRRAFVGRIRWLGRR